MDVLKRVLAILHKITLPHDDSQRPGHPIPVQSIFPDPKAARVSFTSIVNNNFQETTRPRRDIEHNVYTRKELKLFLDASKK